MPYPQGQIPDLNTPDVRYGGGPMASQNVARTLSQGQGVPDFWTQTWPNYIRHNGRLWSPGLGAAASAMSYGWPYEDYTITLKPPPVPAMQMMARGTMAAVVRPGGGQAGFGYGVRIPATPVPINYSRPGY